MADLSQSHEVLWTMYRVNPDTWENMGEVKGFRDGSIHRDTDGSAPLIETATFTFDSGVGLTFEEGWYRLEATFIVNGVQEKEAISTLLFQSGNGVIDRGLDIQDVEGFSTLYPAQERRLDTYGHIPKGADGVDFIKELLYAVTPAPVLVDSENTFTIDRYIVFDIGDSYISIVWNILDAGGWVMYIDGLGQIHLTERPTEPSLFLDYKNAKYVQPEFKYRHSLEDVPNRYYAYYGDESAMAENYGEVDEYGNVDSETSYLARGRWIDYMDFSPVQINGETLQAYAERKLEESSTIYEEWKYTREYISGVYPFSLVYAELPSVGFTGEARVSSQDMNLSHGITVNETVVKSIVTWEA